MKIKKTIAILAIMAVSIFTLTGCETHTAYTFNVENEDQIKVQLDTTNGEKLKQEEGSFTISFEDDEPISIGIFYLSEGFNELYETVATMEGVTILEESDEAEPNYIFYQAITDITTEWNYLIKVEGTQTGVVLSNITSQESAEDVMKLLTYEVNPD